MRIAILSDVHGLVHPLDIALEEISKENVDGIIVAGDMVAGPDPIGAVNRLREQPNCWMIRGNNEAYVLGYASGKAPDWWYTCHQWGFIRWNYENLDAETIDFIRSLPEQRGIRLDGTAPIRVVHGSPRNLSELIFPDRDISKLDSALETVSEPAVIFGHTHEAWQMQRNGKLAVNPGSVSMYFQGKPGRTYAIITWENQQWTSKLRKIDYDFELVQKAYIETGLLEQGNSFARCCLASIKTGVNYLPPMIEYAYKKAAEAGYSASPFVPDKLWETVTREFEETHFKGVL